MDNPLVIIGLSLLGGLILLFIVGSLLSLISVPSQGRDDDGL